MLQMKVATTGIHPDRQPLERSDREGVVLHGSLAFLVAAAVLLAAGVPSLAFAFAAVAFVAVLGLTMAMLTSWMSGGDDAYRRHRFR